MKNVIASSRRLFAIALVASALAFVPATAKATISPEPTNPPSATDVSFSLMISVALSALGL